MKALVTGGGGFLGRHIVQQLVARGDRVRVVARNRYPELDALGVESATGDLRDAQAAQHACQGVDAVFHVAGVAGIWGPWEHYYGINTVATRNVVAGCLQQGVSKLVYTSTPSVTFDGDDQCGVDEAAPYASRWLCHYSHSKALAEQHVLETNGRGGLMTCALRPHLVWGPGDPHLIARVIHLAKGRKLRRVGDGNNLVDHVYVDNAARAHLQAADALEAGSSVCGRAYFITQGQPVNCWEWINAILRLAGVPPVSKSIPYGLAWRVGAVMEAVYGALRVRSEPQMTRFLAAQLAKNHYFNIRRACEDFGYQPQVSTEEGMRRLGAALAAAPEVACQTPLVKACGNG